MVELLGSLIHGDGQPVYIDPLLELIWPNNPHRKSKSALNTLIWRLNSSLKNVSPDGEMKIFKEKDRVVLKLPLEERTSDFASLKNTVHNWENKRLENKIATAENIIELVQVLDGYNGDFLPSLHSDWVIIARERYRSLYIRGCQIAMQQFVEHTNYDRAISFAKKILVENPFRESTRRQVIWLYVMNGQRARAAQVYKETEQILKQELGVKPMLETMALLKLIKEDTDITEFNKRSFSDLVSNIQINRQTLFADLSLISD